jgi:hypothetical protein
MKKVNPQLRFILTVSPVPLTATKSGNHVAVATMASKSILRAVTEELMSHVDVDYFPSYEIINSPIFKGTFFEPNQRSVNPYGVKFVMDNFFECQRAEFGEQSSSAKTLKREGIQSAAFATEKYDEQCEEALLEAFGK